MAMKANDGDAVWQAAIDEITAMLEAVYVGESAGPTPCQLLIGRMLLADVEDAMSVSTQIEEPT
jgi:hypothetical protein